MEDQKRNMKKYALFGGIGVALVLVTAVVMYFLVAPKLGASASARTVAATPPPHYDMGPTFTLDSRVINLADPGASRYLKITAVLAFSVKEDKQDDVNTKIKARQVVLQDIMTSTISTMSVDQLNSAKGKIDLKQALITKFSAVLVELHLSDIYFSEFVMQ